MLHISLPAETIFHIGPIAVNNAMLTGFIGSVLLIVFFAWVGKSLALYPKSRVAMLAESLTEYLLGTIESVTHSRTKAMSYFPFLMTLFLFILANNWLGLLPGVGSIVIHTAEGTVPLFRGANADLNTTLALAVLSVVVIQAYAIKTLGLFKHLKKYFSLNPMLLFVGLLELISEFSKMISFSFRLFGNIFAGEVLLVVISFLMPILGPLPFFGLELFVGVVQALVFTMLTLVFLEIATADHSTSHNEAHATVPAHTSSSYQSPSIPLPSVETGTAGH